MRQAFALLALVAIVSQAATPITVAKAWARATPPGATVGVVYAQLTAARADEVVSVATPVAERVEIHVSTQTDGVAKMRPVDRVKLAAGVPMHFEPGGYHLMLIGLREPLVAGRSFAVTFTFRDAGSLTTRAQIVAPGHRPS